MSKKQTEELCLAPTGLYRTSIFDLSPKERSVAIAIAVMVVEDCSQLQSAGMAVRDSVSVLLDLATRETIAIAKQSRGKGGCS